MNCVILAGGLGTRLRPLTLKIPKPAIEVKGKPIIKHIVEHLENVGFNNIIIKLYYLPHKIKEAIGEDKAVHYIQERKLTATAYFLKKYQKYLEESFLVTNGDTLTDLNLIEFIEFHLINNNMVTVFTHDNAIHSGGTYIFDKKVLEYVQKDDDISDLIQSLIKEQIPINLYYSKAKYFDTANLQKLKKARKYFKI